MSQENVEIVRRVYEKWKDEVLGDPDDETYDVLHPDVEWDVSRRTFDPAVYHGYAGIREFVVRLREVWESGRIEPLEFIPAEDQVVVPVRLHLVSRTHGETTTANAAHVWTLRGGKVIRHCVFQSKAEALEAAGLRE
jgi:ketosteroid isomerase-like protein